MPTPLSFRLLLVTPLLMSAGLLAGCSGEDGGGPTGSASSAAAPDEIQADQAALTKSIAAGLVDDPAMTATEEEASCLAASLVERVGPDVLVDEGIVGTDGRLVPDAVDMADEVAAGFAESFTDCLDPVSMMVEAATAEYGNKLDRSALDACLRDGLSMELTDRMLMSLISGEGLLQPEFEPFFETAAACEQEALGRG